MIDAQNNKLRNTTLQALINSVHDHKHILPSTPKFIEFQGKPANINFSKLMLTSITFTPNYKRPFLDSVPCFFFLFLFLFFIKYQTYPSVLISLDFTLSVGSLKLLTKLGECVIILQSNFSTYPHFYKFSKIPSVGKV